MKIILTAENDDGEVFYRQESGLQEVIEMSLGDLERAIAKHKEADALQEDDDF